MKHFGELLEQRIKETKIPKRTVAEMVSISPNYLSTIFKKNSVDAELMEKLCQAVGMSPAIVFEDNGQGGKSFSDITASAVMGHAKISIGQDDKTPSQREKLYQDLLQEKERTIRVLLSQIEWLKGTEKGHE